MIKQLIWISLLLAAGMTQARAEEGCPYPSSVKYVDGRFQASNGQSHWQSTKVEYRDFADRFIGALFTPGKNTEREKGYLDRCVYRTGSGQVVALRYESQGKLPTMSLTSSLHWEPAVDPLTQDVYICRDSQPDNCSFNVIK